MAQRKPWRAIAQRWQRSELAERTGSWSGAEETWARWRACRSADDVTKRSLVERCATAVHAVARSVTWLSGVEAASDGVPSFRFPHQRECGDERAEERELATTAERRRRMERPTEVCEAPLSRDHAATTREEKRRGSCAAVSSVADSERLRCHNTSSY